MSTEVMTAPEGRIIHKTYAVLSGAAIPQRVHVTQYDESLPVIACTLYKDGQLYTIPDGASVRLRMNKNGLPVYHEAMGIDDARHVVYLEITAQMTVLYGEFAMVIEVETSDGKTAGTSYLRLIVRQNPVQNPELDNIPDYTANSNKLTAEGVKKLQDESSTQQKAIEDKGKNTLESIPADYSALSGKVDENTSGISELKEDLDSFTSKNKNMLTGRYSPISSDGTSLNKYIYYINGEKVSVTLDKGTYAICAYIKTTSENNATNPDNIKLQSVGGTNIKYIEKASSTFTNTKEAVLMQVFSLSQSTNVTFRFINSNVAGRLSFTIENLVLVNVTDVNEAYSYLGKVANGYNDRIVKPIGVNQCAFLEPSVNLLDDSSFSDDGNYRIYTIPNIDVSKTYTVSVFCNLDTPKIVRATLRNGYEYIYLNIISTASNDSFTFTICENNDAMKILDSKWHLDIDVGYDGQKVMLTEGTETYDKFIPYSRFDSIVNSSEFINKVKEIAGKGGTTPAFNPKYIACIGDSLTKGWGGDAPSDVFGNAPVNYPELLQNLIGNQFTVKNFGIAGEDTHAIFARQGSEPIVVKDVTIPSTTDTVELGSKESPLTTVLGNQLKTLMLTGDYGVNPCSITGVDGLLSYNNQKYTFTRLQGGSAVSITRETPLITNMGANYIGNEIPIVWAGTNGTYSSNADLINQIQLAIDHAQCNGKFMVLGLAYDGEYILKNLESDMVASFGDKFINVRDYLSKNGLSDAGLSATDDDITAMSKGKVPPSLMNDTVHFNGYGYIVLANLVYNKGKELGYWK